MFYGSTTGNEWNTTADNQPFTLRQPFPQVYTLSDPYRNTPGGNPVPFSYSPASPRYAFPAQVFGPALDFVWPYAYQMNLTVQREFLRDYSLSASYVGALGASCRRASTRTTPSTGRERRRPTSTRGARTSPASSARPASCSRSSAATTTACSSRRRSAARTSRPRPTTPSARRSRTSITRAAACRRSRTPAGPSSSVRAPKTTAPTSS